MERKTRFELATSSLARRHSTTELLPRTYLIISSLHPARQASGAEEEI
jgi:hypothetical protein